MWRGAEGCQTEGVTVAHRLLTLAQDCGIPVGRWPDPASLGFHLRRLIKVYEIDLVLDVGAHKGEYATLLRREAGYGGDLISFEPAAEAFCVLEKQSAKDLRWRIEQLALGDEPGRAYLKHYYHSTLNSLRRPSQFGSDIWGLHASESEEVPVVRLDDLDLPLESYSGPLLKIDTQGFDLEVLRGAEGILHQIVAMQFEISMLQLYEGVVGFPNMLAEVDKMGFAVSGLFPVAHDARLRAVEFDCVAVRVT